MPTAVEEVPGFDICILKALKLLFSLDVNNTPA